MVSLKILHYSQLYTLLRPPNPSQLVRNPLPISSFVHSTCSNVQEFCFTSSSIFLRRFSACSQLVSASVIEDSTDADSADSEKNGFVKELENEKEMNGKKNLNGMDKGDDGLRPNVKKNRSSKEEEEKVSVHSSLKVIKELKRKVEKLEGELESMKGNVESNEKKKYESEREVKGRKRGVENTREKMKQRGEMFKTLEGKTTNQAKPGSLYSLFASNSNSSSSMFGKDSREKKEPIVSKKEGGSSTLSSKPLKEEKPIKKERDSSIVRSKQLKEKRPIKKELSSEMVSLVSHWYEGGYLNKVKLSDTKELDVSSNLNHYSHELLRFTAEKFGQDHQEIAKWLSGSVLKRVALFGCPSLEKKSAFAAKRLRSFFRIQEDIVCRSCKLKSTCKLVNRRVWDGSDHVNLADVMRVIISYELDMVDNHLEIPNEVKVSISKLLQEVLNLSQ